jgi:hypothetical protein
MSNERECEHGQLRRQCPICEVQARLAELQEAVRWERECEGVYGDRCALCVNTWMAFESYRSLVYAREAVDALMEKQ